MIETTPVKRSSTFVFKRTRSSMRASHSTSQNKIQNLQQNFKNRELNALLLSPQLHSTNHIEKKQLYHAKMFAKIILQSDTITTIQNLCHWFRFYATPEQLMTAILELVNEPKIAAEKQAEKFEKLQQQQQQQHHDQHHFNSLTRRRTQFSVNTSSSTVTPNGSKSSTLKRKSPSKKVSSEKNDKNASKTLDFDKSLEPSVTSINTIPAGYATVIRRPKKQQNTEKIENSGENTTFDDIEHMMTDLQSLINGMDPNLIHTSNSIQTSNLIQSSTQNSKTRPISSSSTSSGSMITPTRPAPPIPMKTKQLLKPSTKNISHLKTESIDYSSGRESGYLSSNAGDHSPSATSTSSFNSGTLKAKKSTNPQKNNQNTLTRSQNSTKQEKLAPIKLTPIKLPPKTTSSHSSTTSEDDTDSLISLPATLNNTLNRKYSQNCEKFKTFVQIWSNIAHSDLQQFSHELRIKLEHMPSIKLSFHSLDQQSLLQARFTKSLVKIDLQNSAKDALIQNGWWNKSTVNSNFQTDGVNYRGSVEMMNSSQSSTTLRYSSSSASLKSEATSVHLPVSPEQMAKTLTSIEMEYLSLCDPGVVMSSLTTLGKAQNSKTSNTDQFLTKQFFRSPQVPQHSYQTSYPTSSYSSSTYSKSHLANLQDSTHACIECYENWYERLSAIVTTEIILSGNLKQATKVSQFWLETLIACKLYGNFNSAISISTGLLQNSVQRIHKKLGLFTSKTESLPPNSQYLNCHQKFFREARSLVDPNKNFYHYRNEYSKYRKTNPELITIPWFLLLRKDLLVLKQHVKSSLDKSKDAEIFQAISAPIMEFTVLQASVYDFVVDESFGGSLEPGERLVDVEKGLTLNGGVLDQNRLMYHSFLLEGAKGSFEKQEYKKLKKCYKK